MEAHSDHNWCLTILKWNRVGLDADRLQNIAGGGTKVACLAGEDNDKLKEECNIALKTWNEDLQKALHDQGSGDGSDTNLYNLAYEALVTSLNLQRTK